MFSIKENDIIKYEVILIEILISFILSCLLYNID